MQFEAKARYLRVSPYKLRPLAEVVRGKSVAYALNWLSTCSLLKRAVPVKKLIESASANARSLQNVEPSQLIIKSFLVDEGPIFRYFKPGAMGRANIQRKRLSHMKIVLETISNTKD